jgi:creatinine amidohydrolase
MSGRSDVALEWRDATAAEVGAAAAGGSLAVLPVGAIEQHGPHLATGTDADLAEEMSRRACAQTADVLLPTMALGCSLGHTDQWPGTLSLTPATLSLVMVETGRWIYASGFRRLVVVNGHGTNGPPYESALLQLRYELPDLLATFVSLHKLTPEITAAYLRDAEDPHANEAETSLMLHLCPDGVRPERIVDEADRTVDTVLSYPMPATTRSGVVGVPSGSSASRGEALSERVVDALVRLLHRARDERVEL